MKQHWTEFDKTIRSLARSQRANFLKSGALDKKPELPEFERIYLQNRKDMRRYKWLTVPEEIPEGRRIVILRRKLRKIESGIIRITGLTPGCYRGWRNSRDLYKLRKLLAARCYLLNQMFRATPAEVGRFEKINAMLRNLTERLYAKTASVYRNLISGKPDPDFDDDFEIEGTLSFNYNWRDSVLELADDNYYKSRFDLMLWVMEAVLHTDGRSLYEILKPYSPNDTPAMSDQELGLTGQPDVRVTKGDNRMQHPALEHIRICPAVYGICAKNDISIPDLLRMNDFWCEVKVTHQHFVAQDGSRKLIH